MASAAASRVNSLSRVRALQVLRTEYWLEFMVNVIGCRQAGAVNPRNPAAALVADRHPERYRELYAGFKTQLIKDAGGDAS